MTTPAVSDFDLTLLHQTRNEVYRGVHLSTGQVCIIKFHNDLASKEAQIMQELAGKVDNIPIVHLHSTGDYTAPSGKSYRYLIIWSCCEGKVLTPSKGLDGTVVDHPGQVGREHFTITERKTLVERLIELVAQLHECGVVYADDFLTNTVISTDSLEPQLIDFGQSYYIDGPRELLPLTVRVRQVKDVRAPDIFSLMGLIHYMFDIPHQQRTFPEGWHSMNARELLPYIPDTNAAPELKC